MDRAPEFTLYGEESSVTDAAFLHLELLSSRSRRFDWEIADHCHRGLFQLLCLLDGEVKARIDDREYPLSGPAAICLPPATVHGFSFLEEAQGFVLTVAESALTHDPDQAGALLRPLLQAPRLVDLRRDWPARERIESLFGQLLAELHWPQRGQDLMVDCLLKAILLMLARLVDEQDAAGGGHPAERDLLARFHALLEERYREHWDIPRYADALCVTASKLNRASLKLSRKTAFALTQERLMLEARRMLAYSAWPISRVAYDLGFNDPAYFCRCFKRQLGLSPSEFRNKT
ncbi:hypothetical protein VI26_20565 [Chromobacterium sp. LK1]|uniref:helix-turn-helix domain-containing protein n=1 Tax=Chromobacterium sp. LK1 TaxID=1628193 RepID=UPI000653BB44|nr:helix-turn-helix domain-containing protein [Chromobacterium sp. LK1]KMN30888.1 hypothetical protein VI26_20565 [Chromobacterium sp. LK1]